MNEYFPPPIPGRVFGIPSSLVGPKVLATLPPLVEVAVWLDVFPPETVKNKHKYIKPRINDLKRNFDKCTRGNMVIPLVLEVDFGFFLLFPSDTIEL